MKVIKENAKVILIVLGILAVAAGCAFAYEKFFQPKMYEPVKHQYAIEDIDMSKADEKNYPYMYDFKFSQLGTNTKEIFTYEYMLVGRSSDLKVGEGAKNNPKFAVNIEKTVSSENTIPAVSAPYKITLDENQAKDFRAQLPNVPKEHVHVEGDYTFVFLDNLALDKYASLRDSSPYAGFRNAGDGDMWGNINLSNLSWKKGYRESHPELGVSTKMIRRPEYAAILKNQGIDVNSMFFDKHNLYSTFTIVTKDEKGKEKKAHVKVMGDNLLQTKIDGVNLVPTFSIEQTNTYLDVYGFPPVE